MNVDLKPHKKSSLERAIKNTTSHSIKLNYAYKRALTRRRSWLFITCTPKSGSTFLARSLSIATGFKEYKLVEDVHKEQDMYFPRMIDAYNMDLVTRQHTKANAPNIQRLREFGVRPVVLTRDLADSVVSARDYIADDGVFPGLSIPDPFRGLDEERQFDFVIDMIMPWYVDFLAGWYRVSTNGSMPVLWVRYEDMLADKAGTLKQILDHFEVAKLKVSVDDAIAATDGRKEVKFNVGKVGRGRQKLSDAQMARLVHLAEWIPSEARHLSP